LSARDAGDEQDDITTTSFAGGRRTAGDELLRNNLTDPLGR
jgi:hypothetical protein